MASAATQAAMSNLPPNEDRQASFLAFNYIIFGIGTIVLLLRLYARFKIRSLGLDDWLMLAAWHLWVADVITCTLYSVSGGTRHIFYITDPMDITNILKYGDLDGAFGNLAQAVGKLSIGVMIVRLMERGAFKVHKIMIYTFMAIHAVMTILLVIFLFVQCKPQAAQRDSTNFVTESCWDRSIFFKYGIAQASFGAFLDFFLALSPMPIILPLALKLSKKIALCGLLALGVSAGICSAARTAQQAKLSSSIDQTWDAYNIYILLGMEIFLVVICGCIPTLKPLYGFLIHGTTMTPDDIPSKANHALYKLYNSSHTRASESSESQDQYMLNRHDMDTGYLVQSQADGGTQDSAGMSGIRCTQSFEVRSYTRI